MIGPAAAAQPPDDLDLAGTPDDFGFLDLGVQVPEIFLIGLAGQLLPKSTGALRPFSELGQDVQEEIPVELEQGEPEFPMRKGRAAQAIRPRLLGLGILPGSVPLPAFHGGPADVDRQQTGLAGRHDPAPPQAVGVNVGGGVSRIDADMVVGHSVGELGLADLLPGEVVAPDPGDGVGILGAPELLAHRDWSTTKILPHPLHHVFCYRRRWGRIFVVDRPSNRSASIEIKSTSARLKPPRPCT